MEKVFSKVLPTFTENVKQLNDITEELKRMKLDYAGFCSVSRKWVK